MAVDHNPQCEKHRKPTRRDTFLAAQSTAAAVGQMTALVVTPRRSSMRMSARSTAPAAVYDGIASATIHQCRLRGSAIAAGRVVAACVACVVGTVCSARRHLCTGLAFNPYDIATWATDALCCMHSASTRAFNSSMCGRRVTRLLSSMVST